MIGEMNRKITLKSYTTSKDAGGGVSAVVDQFYSIWAKVEARSGSLYTGQEQALWNYDYKVTFRYEKTRVVKSNFIIEYDSKVLQIKSISYLDEGNRKYCVCRCSATTT